MSIEGGSVGKGSWASGAEYQRGQEREAADMGAVEDGFCMLSL